MFHHAACQSMTLFHTKTFLHANITIFSEYTSTVEAKLHFMQQVRQLQLFQRCQSSHSVILLFLKGKILLNMLSFGRFWLNSWLDYNSPNHNMLRKISLLLFNSAHETTNFALTSKHHTKPHLQVQTSKHHTKPHLQVHLLLGPAHTK